MIINKASLDYQGVYNGPINNCKIINHYFFIIWVWEEEKVMYKNLENMQRYSYK